MFIQTETTPNPETLKFIPDVVVMPNGTATYILGDECKDSPLAKKLLAVDGIRGVFFGHDFITLTKNTDKTWDILKPSVLSTLLDHFTTGFPVVENTQSLETPEVDDSDPVVKQIKEIIEERVRPAVAQDGGDIVFHSFKDGIVYLEMHGACSGCPSSTATLKSGIENMLRYYLPEVLEVRAIEK